jgi:cytoplasmic iron level regulating protein YaaA (DUF328/UPF0246 family)
MKILFSPSEGKSDLGFNPPINKDSFCCEELFDKRVEVVSRYQEIINTKDIEKLKQLFGLKDEQKCLELCKNDIINSLTCKAIKRYTGVAYEYLKYNTLEKKYQNYLDKNVIIFSNLFGPILARDNLPDYKLKQGAKLEGFKIENFYKEHFSKKLDEILKDEFIIDLRAGFYEKFYKLSYPYITMKFIKNGKVVSHWAKAYRGIVLRQLAIDNIASPEEFKNMEIDNLEIQEIHQKGLKTEFIYNIST